MNLYEVLFSIWGLDSLLLAVLLVYRSRLTRQESDWIPLTEDEREDRAIQTQAAIEKKAGKLTWPIRALAAASVLLLLFILGFWVYSGINSSPAG